MNLPVKFFLNEAIEIQDKFKGVERTPQIKKEIKQLKLKVIMDFDTQMKQVNIPRILLERLKKEFDDSHSLSTQFGKPN